jgi:tetratricopeptide (TPR) repeat protein
MPQANYRGSLLLTALTVLLVLTACASPEARSLTGDPLYAQVLPEQTRLSREAALAIAQERLANHPDDEDAIIWVGRRAAYLGRYREAVDRFTEGLALHPDSHRLLRHRGHRYITLRQLDAAISDLEVADQHSRALPNSIEPDGMPNAQNMPRSTTKGNILYHLALARYLQGNFADSAADFKRCLDLATNDDARVAAAYWLYLSAHRAGEGDRADVADLAALALSVADRDADLLENHTYNALLLVFRGQSLSETADSHLDSGVDEATLGYGLSMKAMFDGDAEAARAHWETIIAETSWAAFGHIAAEAELARSSR